MFIMSELTKGQLAIRQIITQHLKEYLSIDDTDRIAKSNLFNKIQKIFESTSEIVNDSVTGRYEGYKDISHYYISHLNNIKINPSQEPIKSDFPNISFHSFILDGNGSNNKRKLFMGGCKAFTTFQALFTLAQGQTVPMQDYDVTKIAYHKKSGIITCSEGTHRTLGHILWGESKIAPCSMSIVDESHLDNDLNKALLILENNESKPYITFDSHSKNEIDKVKRVAFESTEREKNILAEYCQSRSSKIKPDFKINNIDILLTDLKRIEKRNLLQKFYFHLQINLEITREFSDLEYWFDYIYSKKK
jgi:hypothetical protein